MTKTYRLKQSQFIPGPREEVFSFFADAAKLERLTPAFLHFHILKPLPILMKPGALIDYELKLYGVPVRWRTRIETFEPGSVFTDVQLSGPYRRWRHRHEFADVPGGTEMRDIVDYELPLGPLGVAARWLFVRHALDRIFDYRRVAITEVFGAWNPLSGFAGSGSNDPASALLLGHSASINSVDPLISVISANSAVTVLRSPSTGFATASGSKRTAGFDPGNF